MDENLARWIFISVAKHFEPVASGLSLPYLVEGITERTEDEIWEDHVEMRMTGPFIKEQSRDFYTVEVAINFLFTALMDMDGADAYRHLKWLGEFQKEMLEPIPIYRFGVEVADDQTLIDCLRVKKNAADAVRSYLFGQISKDVRITQAELDAMYELTLSS
jgi:hypothetical protein